MSVPTQEDFRRLPLALIFAWLTGRVLSIREGVRAMKYAEASGMRFVTPDELGSTR